MRYLIGMELKRLFKSMKNLFVLTLFLLTLLILAFYNDKRDGEYEADRETIYNQSLSADFTTITMISMDYIDTLSEEEAKNFNHVYPADVTEKQNYWFRDQEYTNKQLQALKRGDWEEELKLTLDKDRNMLEGLLKGVIEERNTISGDISTIQELDNRIRWAQYLLDNHIKPEYSEYKATGFLFLQYCYKYVFPILIPVVLCLLSSDCISTEMETGSMKILLLMPERKRNLYISKLVANVLFSVATIVTIILISFIGVGIRNGFGNPKYPMTSAYDQIHPQIPSVIDTFNQTTVDYVSIMKGSMILLLLLIIFIIFMITIIVSASCLINQISTSMGVIGSLVLIPNVLPLLGNSNLKNILVRYCPLCYGYFYDLLHVFQKQIILILILIELLIIFICIITINYIVKRKDWIC